LNCMINRLQTWLNAEINSRILTEPPFKSYVELAEEISEELENISLPYAVQDDFKKYLINLLVSIMELRFKKIILELIQGNIPANLTAEESRLVSAIRRIAESGAGVRKTREYVVVRFLRKFPILVTSDFKQIGPFDKGDLAKLPVEDARELEAREIVEIFDKIFI